MIELAQTSRRVVLDNATTPSGDRRRLPEADQANMEQFLANMRVILPVIGLDLLKAQPAAVRRTEVPVRERVEDETTFEIRHKSAVKARAVEEEGEFVVLEGSEALRGMNHVMQSYAALKDEMIESGVLARASDDRFVFTKPYGFRSPSAAAAVVLDRNSNGRTEWKVRGEALSYQQWQDRRAAEEHDS